MEVFDIWDVIKVPFPYTDHVIQQRRPALVVARHAAEGMPALLWVFMITSAAHRRWPDDVEVSNSREAGLPIPSIVRPTKIATVEVQYAELIGRLPEVNRPAVTAFLTEAFQDLGPAATASIKEQ